ncbi:(5-formylfuran-3-yl)methyl phosphate synthase [Methylophilus sp.]|uniref:(5-formylfuran-3-yl)methyl phosphate synthase n=1 Tax=Methylophilus sp. TaxID=29541 RepID=UPI003F9FAF7A
MSVSSVAEAQMALSADVRLIDLKETSHGALAALDLALSESIIKEVNLYRQQHPQAGIIVSATIGDDCPSAEVLAGLIQSRIEIGVDVIKLPQTIWADAAYASVIQEFLIRQIKLIAVLSADHFSGKETLGKHLQALASAAYWGVMVDTIQKSRPLTALISLTLLDFFVSSAKSLGLYVGLAGGLKLEHFDSLADLSPDYLGFRSGLCLNQRREQPLIKEKLHLVMAKVSEFC